MPQQKIFTRYLAPHHEDELYNAVAAFVAANPDALGLRSYRVDEISAAIEIWVNPAFTSIPILF